MSRKRILWIAVVVLVLAVVSALFLSRRDQSTPAAAAAAPRSAAVVSVTRGTLSSSLTVAGQFIAYQVVDLHAKVSGYIRWIGVDIGDRVRTGQTLATLEVPELQDQYIGAQAEVGHTRADLIRARSEVASAQATYQAAHLDYTRLEQASQQRPGLIAQQELDDAQAKDQEAEAQVGVARASQQALLQQLGVSRANSHRFQTLTNYEHIIAPFNGVITMRYADTGSLIQAGQGSNTQSLPVVQVSQSDLLRLRIPVPEADVPGIRDGGEVTVKVSATGNTFTGHIARFTRALDPSTRTMLIEVDVPNPQLTLSPGMYADTTIQLQQRNNTLILPTQAIVQNGSQNGGQDGAQPYVLVVDRTHHVERRSVTLGIQTSNRSEILSGVRAGESVIASGQTGYEAGEKVTPQPAFIPTEAQEEGK